MMRFPVNVYSELLGCSHCISPAHALKLLRRLINVNNSMPREEIQEQKVYMTGYETDTSYTSRA